MHVRLRMALVSMSEWGDRSIEKQNSRLLLRSAQKSVVEPYTKHTHALVVDPNTCRSFFWFFFFFLNSFYPFFSIDSSFLVALFTSLRTGPHSLVETSLTRLRLAR